MHSLWTRTELGKTGDYDGNWVRYGGGLDLGNGRGGEKWWDSGYRLNRGQLDSSLASANSFFPRAVCQNNQ